jgi:hypothetical protein
LLLIINIIINFSTVFEAINVDVDFSCHQHYIRV